MVGKGAGRGSGGGGEGGFSYIHSTTYVAPNWSAHTY